MKKTHKNPLTPEQVIQLLKNRYVKSATQNSVRFTEEFKRYFYQKHTSGMTVRSIFLECGIDPDVLGESRISGFCHTVNVQAKRDTGFSDNRQNNYRRPPKSEDETVESRIKQLEHELAYTRQEVEFLKKLQAANMEAQKKWGSRHRQK